MAFETFNLLIARGKINTQASSTNVIMHTYTSAVDSIATMITAGYFPAFLGSTAENVKVGDQITINGTDDIKVYQLSVLNPITLVETFGGLSVQTFQHSTTWGGAFSTPVTPNPIEIRKIGTVVTAIMPEFFATADVAATITATTQLPPELRPILITGEQNYATWVRDISNEQIGAVTIFEGTGDITIGSSKPLLPFGGSGNTGLFNTTISWITTS